MLNHGSFLSIFMVFGRKYILKKMLNSGLKSRLLYCLRLQVITNLPETSPFVNYPNVCAKGKADKDTFNTIPKFRFSLLLGLIWQLSKNQTKYNEGWSKLSYLSRITGFALKRVTAGGSSEPFQGSWAHLGPLGITPGAIAQF